MTPQIEQQDAAWVYLDVGADQPAYILECWTCELRARFLRGPVDPSLQPGYYPKYLADTVNQHNRQHNGG